MTVHRLEVYVDSYKNRPFVKDFEDAINLTPNDERQIEEWIRSLSGKNIRIDRHLRIEDVKHHFLESVDKQVQATSIRVSIVD